MLYELARLAIDNLGRARARLAMTAAGVLVGTAAVILLVALTIGLQQAAEAGIGSSVSLTRIDVYPGWTPDPEATIPQLDNDAVRAFWQIRGVQVVIPIVNLQGGELRAGDYSGWAWTIGVDPALLPYMGITTQRGELSLNPGEAIVGARVGSNFYDPKSEVWEPITVDIFETPVRLHLFQFSGEAPSERRIDLHISGEIREGTEYDYAILMPIDDVIKYNEWITGQRADPATFRYDQIIVMATSRETTNDVTEAIREMGYSAGGAGDFLNQLNSFFGTMRLALGGVGGVALVVAAFGVANTMMMAIMERTREIGLMKALGATDRDVLTVFLIEAGLVGFFGGLAGVGVSLALQSLVNQAMEQLSVGGGGGVMFLPIDPNQIGGNLLVIPSELALLAVALATLVGVGAGLYPALRAAQMLPVNALKQE